MRIVWFGDIKRTIDFFPGYVIASLKPDVVLCHGDIGVAGFNVTAWGYTSVAVDKDATANDFLQHHLQVSSSPGWLAMKAAAKEIWYMADDHEWGGDDWDHTVASANRGLTPLNVTLQSEVDAHWWAGVQAIESITSTHFDNPTNTDAEAIAETPSEAAASAAQYPVRYMRQGFDIAGNRATNPFIEVFEVDNISYKSPVADADTVAKTMLGRGSTSDGLTDGQLFWLKNRLSASTATFKIISSSKKSWVSANGDDWDKYGSERAVILDYIAAQGITGVIWITGDAHIAYVIGLSTANGKAYNHTDICASPSSDGNLSANVDVDYLYTNGKRRVFGMLDITETKIVASIHDSGDGRILWTGEALAGGNVLSYNTGVGGL